MLNYTSEKFNPINHMNQERKRHKNFGKINTVSAFTSAANAKSSNPNKIY